MKKMYRDSMCSSFHSPSDNFALSIVEHQPRKQYWYSLVCAWVCFYAILADM